MKKTFIYWPIIVIVLIFNAAIARATDGFFKQKNGSVEISIAVKSAEDSTLLTEVDVQIYNHLNSKERLLKDGTTNKDYVPNCELIIAKKVDKNGMISLVLLRDRNFKITFLGKGKQPQSFYIDTWFLPNDKRISYNSMFYMKSCSANDCNEDLSYFRIVRYDKNKSKITSSDIIIQPEKIELKKDGLFDFTASNSGIADFKKSDDKNEVNLLVEKSRIGIVNNSDTINLIDSQLLRQGKWKLFDDVKSLFSAKPGKVFYEGTYRQDQKEGKWFLNTVFGKKRLSFLFERGSFQRQVEVFDESENQQIVANFDTTIQQFTGELKTFYTSGQIELQLNLNDSAKKEGKQLAFYTDGALAVMSTYKDNKKDGLTLIYTQDGSLGAKQTYKEGKLVAEDKFVDTKKMTEALKLMNRIDQSFGSIEQEIGAALRGLKLSEEQYISTISAQFVELKRAKDAIENQQKLMLKSAQELEIEKLESKVKSEEIAKSRQLLISSVVALVLCILFLFVVYKQSNERKRMNALLLLKNEEINAKKQEIIDSIQYAKRLQNALLPTMDSIKHQLPQSFLFFRPKDIVSGDFYWSEQVGDSFYLAIADCTGHGVPGAVVSMICHTSLSRSILEFGESEPGNILTKTAELVATTFNKSGQLEVKDGMDISLVCINKKAKIMSWAGAHNSIYWVDNEGINELKGDKHAIGLNQSTANFTTHSLQMDLATTYYMITDGVVDQFGGEKGKKFKTSNFKKLLQDIYTKPITMQEETIVSTFEAWKGDFEQVDDVSVFGFKLG